MYKLTFLSILFTASAIADDTRYTCRDYASCSCGNGSTVGYFLGSGTAATESEAISLAKREALSKCKDSGLEQTADCRVRTGCECQDGHSPSCRKDAPEATDSPSNFQ